MQYARRNVPARARGQPVGCGEIGDVVITLGEVLQAGFQLFFGRAWAEAEKGVGEIRAVVVDLRWEVIGFWLAGHTDQPGVLLAVVDMVGQSALIVKEFREHRPAVVRFPQPPANQAALQFGDRIAQQHLFLGRPSSKTT